LERYLLLDTHQLETATHSQKELLERHGANDLYSSSGSSKAWLLKSDTQTTSFLIELLMKKIYL
jgi:hypothetical protein